MASGTYNLSLEHPSSSVSFQGKLEWTSTSNGSSANTSNVVVKLYARKQGSSTATSGTFKGSITIDGTKTTFNQNKSVQNSWVLISTSSKTVSHNADGTKSITIAGEVGKVSGTTLSNINSTGSTSITLDTIPRYASIQSVQITDDENPIGVVINAPAYNSYTNLEICVSRDNYTPIDNWRSILNMSTAPLLAYLYDLNATELNAIYNNNTTTNTPTIYIIVRSTLNGTSQTSKSTQTLPIINANPVLSSGSFTYNDSNASIVAITGDNQKIVQSLSTLQINWTTPTFKKGATLQGISFDFTGGVNDSFTSSSTSGNHTYSGTINGQNINVHITCEDSRGNYATPIDITIPVIQYQKAQISAYIRRLNNYEDTTYIDATASISSVDSINSLQTFKYRYSQYGTGTWSAWGNLTNGTTETVSLDKNYQWGFEIVATDKFTTSDTYTFTLNKGVFPLFIDTVRNSVGINCFPANYDDLEVAYGLRVSGNAYITGDLEVLGKIINRNIITAKLSADYTITSSGNHKLTISQETKIGSKLSISSGEIVIGANIEYVLVSAKLNYNVLASGTASRYIFIYKNNNAIVSGREQPVSGGGGVCLSLPPTLIQVQVGDRLTIGCQGSNNDVIRATADGAIWSYITVEAI